MLKGFFNLGVKDIRPIVESLNCTNSNGKYDKNSSGRKSINESNMVY